jgi:hypothetical protein
VKVGQCVKKNISQKSSVRREPRIAGLGSNVLQCALKNYYTLILAEGLIFYQLNYGVEKIVPEGKEYKKIITFYLRLQNDEGSEQT